MPTAKEFLKALYISILILILLILPFIEKSALVQFVGQGICYLSLLALPFLVMFFAWKFLKVLLKPIIDNLREFLKD